MWCKKQIRQSVYHILWIIKSIQGDRPRKLTRMTHETVLPLQLCPDQASKTHEKDLKMGMCEAENTRKCVEA